jgi:hypothetical protein
MMRWKYNANLKKYIENKRKLATFRILVIFMILVVCRKFPCFTGWVCSKQIVENTVLHVFCAHVIIIHLKQKLAWSKV